MSKKVTKTNKTAKELMKDYPNTCPIKLEFKEKKMKKNYLAPESTTLQQLLYSTIRKRLEINENESITLFVKKDGKEILPCLTDTIQQIYSKYKSKDDFLYMECTLENTFG